MKNYRFTIVLAAVAVLASCKKDRVCNCTVTTVGITTTTTSSTILPIDTTVYTPLYTTNTIKSTFKKVKKGTAKSNCFGKSENISETTNNSIPGVFNITNTNTGTRTYDCKLE